MSVGSSRSLLQQLSGFLRFSLCANEIAAQDSDRNSGGEPAPFIDRSVPSSFPDFQRCFEIPRQNENISPVTGNGPDIAEIRIHQNLVLCRKGGQDALRFVDVTASTYNTAEQCAHAIGCVRINFERMPGRALGFFPHPQWEVSVGEICRDRGVSRILFESSFELVQTTFPLPLPAMDVTRILQRSGSVRLQL